MLEYIYNLAQTLPPELAVVLLSITPITEIRLSIPFAMQVYGFTPYQAMFWSVLGDAIPAALLVYYLGPISRFLMKRSSMARRFFAWLFSKTRQKFPEDYSNLGKIALMLFVALPFPGFGAWSGAIAAWLFDMKKTEALIFILLGIILAALAVTGLSVGIFSIFKL